MAMWLSVSMLCAAPLVIYIALFAQDLEMQRFLRLKLGE